MQLHQLGPKTKFKDRKRVGRGGKRGTTSGRGTKGQKSRSGHRIRPAERDLIQRVPKLRGFSFKPLRPKAAVVNVGDLERKMENNIIDLNSLITAGLVRWNVRRVKILGEGSVKRPLEIKGLQVSAEAKKKIEAVGGKIVIV